MAQRLLLVNSETPLAYIHSFCCTYSFIQVATEDLYVLCSASVF